MSDIPAKESGTGYLRVASDTKPSHDAELDFAAPPVGERSAPAHRASMTILHGPGEEPGAGPRPMVLIVGLMLLFTGTVLATLPIETWKGAVTFLLQGTSSTTDDAAPSPPDATLDTLSSPLRYLTTETSRWIVSGLLIVAALSVLRARAFAVIVTGGLFALTAFSCDELLAGRLSRFVSTWFGEGSPRYVLPLVSAAFGYLVHASPANAKISVRGIIGLLIVAVAGFGTIHNWYDWSPMASRIGPTASELLSEWTEECTWATVLILTAIGVASSRTRPIHLLIALMLLALAYHCVSSGLSQMRAFPELAVHDYVPTVEDINYRNVEAWRWVVAVELALLAAILLHLSLGMGALNLAFATTWMIAGMAIYGAVGNMSLLRTFSEGYSASRTAEMPGAAGQPRTGDPLANWGLPIGPPQTQSSQQTQTTPPRVAPPTTSGAPATSSTPSAPSTLASQDLDAARMRAMASIQRPATIREITPLFWMFFTAALAGLIAVTGVSMMTSSRALRRLALCVLWVSLGIAGTMLWNVWPKGSETWLGWLAAWRYSQHHTSAIWLTFLGSGAIFGFWALRHDANLATWVHASAAAILMGTCLTLGAVAILIYWGGFPNLPTWVYIAIAAGQSSLMWALLMHQCFAERRARRLA